MSAVFDNFNKIPPLENPNPNAASNGPQVSSKYNTAINLFKYFTFFSFMSVVIPSIFKYITSKQRKSFLEECVEAGIPEENIYTKSGKINFSGFENLMYDTGFGEIALSDLQNRALDSGVDVNEIINHDWTYSAVDAFNLNVPVRVVLENEWTYKSDALRRGVDLESVLDERWSSDHWFAIMQGISVEKVLSLSHPDLLEESQKQSEINKAKYAQRVTYSGIEDGIIMSRLDMVAGDIKSED